MYVCECNIQARIHQFTRLNNCRNYRHANIFVGYFANIIILFLNFSIDAGVFCARRLSAGSPTRGTRTQRRHRYIHAARVAHTCVASLTLPLFPCPSSL